MSFKCLLSYSCLVFLCVPTASGQNSLPFKDLLFGQVAARISFFMNGPSMLNREVIAYAMVNSFSFSTNVLTFPYLLTYIANRQTTTGTIVMTRAN